MNWYSNFQNEKNISRPIVSNKCICFEKKPLFYFNLFVFFSQKIRDKFMKRRKQNNEKNSSKKEHCTQFSKEKLYNCNSLPKWKYEFGIFLTEKFNKQNNCSTWSHGTFLCVEMVNCDSYLLCLLKRSDTKILNITSFVLRNRKQIHSLLCIAWNILRKFLFFGFVAEFFFRYFVHLCKQWNRNKFPKINTKKTKKKLRGKCSRSDCIITMGSVSSNAYIEPKVNGNNNNSQQ